MKNPKIKQCEWDSRGYFAANLNRRETNTETNDRRSSMFTKKIAQWEVIKQNLKEKKIKIYKKIDDNDILGTIFVIWAVLALLLALATPIMLKASKSSWTPQNKEEIKKSYKPNVRDNLIESNKEK
jgi:hypothetical protein